MRIARAWRIGQRIVYLGFVVEKTPQGPGIRVLFPVAMIAQSGTLAALARAGIDAGNQALINGVKTGNIALITATVGRFFAMVSRAMQVRLTS